MNETQPATNEDNDSRWYEIRIEGHLDDRWATWFEGLNLTRDTAGFTRLTGPVLDQAALHGLLKKVRDLALPLLAVTQIEPPLSEDPAVERK